MPSRFDLVPSILLCLLMLAYYGWGLSLWLLLLPLFVLGTVLAASGTGFILSALSVQFRDVKYVVPFLIQAGLFATPVIYPIAYIPQRYQVWMGLNPMAGMAEGFRLAILGTPPNWAVIGTSLSISAAAFRRRLVLLPPIGATICGRDLNGRGDGNRCRRSSQFES